MNDLMRDVDTDTPVLHTPYVSEIQTSTTDKYVQKVSTEIQNNDIIL